MKMTIEVKSFMGGEEGLIINGVFEVLPLQEYIYIEGSGLYVLISKSDVEDVDNVLRIGDIVFVFKDRRMKERFIECMERDEDAN